MTKGERNKDISDRGRNNKEISMWERNKKILVILVYKDGEKTTKGENLTQGERYDKEKESIRILSTQVGGASS